MNVEHENLARALREEPLLVKSRWCSFGLHTWEQWSKVYTHKNDRDVRPIQHRHCAMYNKVEAIRVEIKDKS